jgi:hypothetical protein
MNIASNGKQDIRIEFEDNLSSLQYNEMKEKHEKLRDGNDQLQSESNNAFRKANIQGWRDLF